MSGTFPAALERELVSLAMTWRLERADGVVLGFTSHDRDLRCAGVMFRACPGVTVSAIAARSLLEDDGISLSGPVRSDMIRADEVDAGRWDEARVAVDLVDWSNPGGGAVRLFVGQVSSFAIHGGPFGNFELEAQRDLALRANIGPLRCSPMCRATLGDRRCGVDMASRTIVARIVGLENGGLVLAAPVDGPAVVGGSLRFLSGEGAGITAGIVEVEGATLRLDREPGPSSVGARVQIREGCDKRFATCVERFGNAAAFDGEPHVPGHDLLLRYGAP